MKRILVGAMLAALCATASADISESDLANLKGYTILGSWTITGWYDPGKKGSKGDAFEGCEFGRVLILDGNLSITCAEYNYSYSYRPTAVILGDGQSFKMLMGGHVYSMTK